MTHVAQTVRRMAVLAALALVPIACTQGTPMSPSSTAFGSPSQAQSMRTAASTSACWGQATSVFAAMGEMGTHSSQQSNPRLGLRNLARALYDDGVIPDDSMEALGAFVASELGLSIDACL